MMRWLSIQCAIKQYYIVFWEIIRICYKPIAWIQSLKHFVHENVPIQLQSFWQNNSTLVHQNVTLFILTHYSHISYIILLPLYLNIYIYIYISLLMREENVKVNFFVDFCPNDTLDGEFFAISVLKSQVTPCPFLGCSY